MIVSDRKVISQCPIGKGFMLQRVINKTGEHLSAIMQGDREIWVTPTIHEMAMIRAWNEGGWRAFA